MNKKDRMAATLLVDKTTQAIRDVTVAQREITMKQMALQREELETRDRVDISLKEYEKMKDRIRELESEKDAYEKILSKFNFPIDAQVVPGSVKTSYKESPMSDPMNKAFMCRISFLTMEEPVW